MRVRVDANGRVVRGYKRGLGYPEVSDWIFKSEKIRNEHSRVLEVMYFQHIMAAKIISKTIEKRSQNKQQS